MIIINFAKNTILLLAYTFSSFLVINEEKVICYQLELGKITVPKFQLNVPVVMTTGTCTKKSRVEKKD